MATYRFTKPAQDEDELSMSLKLYRKAKTVGGPLVNYAAVRRSTGKAVHFLLSDVSGDIGTRTALDIQKIIRHGLGLLGGVQQ